MINDTESAQASSGCVPGHHRARFGEIEQRGAALTVSGRSLYDCLFAAARAEGITAKNEIAFADKFASFPDSWGEIREQGLAWFWYYISPSKLQLPVPLWLLLT